MSWEYRIIRHTDPDGSHDFAIHEVYYDNDTLAITGWTENSVGISGIDYKALTRDAARYQSAFTRSVLAVESDALFDIGIMGHGKPMKVWEKPPLGRS